MPALDRYAQSGAGLTTPVTRAEAVTPSDAAELTRVSQILYVGGAGNVSVVMAGGDTVTFTAVPAGTQLFIRAKQVRNTGTTATNIVALD